MNIRKIWFIFAVIALIVLLTTTWLKSMGVTEASLPPALLLCLKLIACVGVGVCATFSGYHLITNYKNKKS